MKRYELSKNTIEWGMHGSCILYPINEIDSDKGTQTPRRIVVRDDEKLVDHILRLLNDPPSERVASFEFKGERVELRGSEKAVDAFKEIYEFYMNLVFPMRNAPGAGVRLPTEEEERKEEARKEYHNSIDKLIGTKRNQSEVKYGEQRHWIEVFHRLRELEQNLAALSVKRG